ncbi:MAG: DEAD/DEAH box helicase, partial [Erysipelotrichaceae bacterium]
MSKFNELNLSPEILRAVDEMGYESATQIQSETIPLIMDGRDVLGRSNTGTGKTAAFGIPAIERIDTNNRMPQVLIICPTRELVTQVASELRKFSKYKEGVKIVPIYGGQPIDGQIRLLKRGCGIVVGTPGRIMDHLKRKTLKFTDTKMVILDEADEMLNMGFKEDIEEILKSMPADGSHQTILFSATMPAAIMKITKQFQDNPALVEIKSATRT